MDSTERLLQLIHQVYAAPGSQDGWQAFLEAVCAAVDGAAANFISRDVESRQGGIVVTARMDPDALTAYNERWATLDPWMNSPRISAIAPGTVALGDELVSHSDVKPTAYYADFARSYDLVRVVGSLVEAGPRAVSVVAITGSESRGPFSRSDAALLEALVPHVRRALQIHRRLAVAETIADSLASLVERAVHGVLFVDLFGRVTFMNDVARTLVALQDGLLADGRELCASRPADTNRLRRLVAAAAATTRGEGTDTGGMLALGRPSGRRPLMLVVAPLSGRRAVLADIDPPAAMVIVSDPDALPVPDEGMLRALFNLTPAEAKLTRLLVQGLTLSDAAARLGLRTQTVRTRVKAIFEKTNTHRQADLVRLILNSMPRV